MIIFLNGVRKPCGGSGTWANPGHVTTSSVLISFKNHVQNCRAWLNYSKWPECVVSCIGCDAWFFAVLNGGGDESIGLGYCRVLERGEEGIGILVCSRCLQSVGCPEMIYVDIPAAGSFRGCMGPCKKSDFVEIILTLKPCSKKTQGRVT